MNAILILQGLHYSLWHSNVEKRRLESIAIPKMTLRLDKGTVHTSPAPAPFCWPGMGGVCAALIASGSETNQIRAWKWRSVVEIKALFRSAGRFPQLRFALTVVSKDTSVNPTLLRLIKFCLSTNTLLMLFQCCLLSVPFPLIFLNIFHTSPFPSQPSQRGEGPFSTRCSPRRCSPRAGQRDPALETVLR